MLSWRNSPFYFYRYHQTDILKDYSHSQRVLNGYSRISLYLKEIMNLPVFASPKRMPGNANAWRGYVMEVIVIVIFNDCRLQCLADEEWGDSVTIVSCDMRDWEAPEKADILVSELLGSFGDNELSPECLDGAQKFLKGSFIRHFIFTIFY